MAHQQFAVSGHHRYRRASHLYNESWREIQISQISSVVDTKRTLLRHSKMIPPWLWSFFTVVFGISTDPNVRPITATFLYCFTLFFAFLHASTSGFYIYSDVVSANTKTTIFTGTAAIILGVAWIMIGIYGNDVARRILRNKGLMNNVRMHARTIFRLNAALAISLVALAALGIHIYIARSVFENQRCQLVNLNPLVCQLSYISSCVYSSLVLFWNVIVAYLCMSMCRTFTIVCRRFIRELEREGKVLEKLYRLKLNSRMKEAEDMHQRALIEPSVGGLWDVGDTLAEVSPSAYMEDVESDLSDEDCIPPSTTPRVRSRSNFSNQHFTEASVPSTIPEVPSSAETSQTVDLTNSSILQSENELHTISHGEEPRVEIRRPHCSHQVPPEEQHTEPEDIKNFEKMLFTEEDLCMRFWKITCQLRITSLVFQRWLSTWCAFVAFWAFSYIVYWLNHRAELLDFVYFLLPILLVTIVCTAYAEVNLESSRIMYSLCPRAGRLQFNRFINSQPAYLTVFSMPMTYQVIAGLIIAFGVAFASRIIMDEFRAAN